MSVHSKRHLQAATLLVLLFASPALAQTGKAVQQIERFNSTLMTIMQNAQSLKFTGRYKTLAPVILDSFDMDFMARFSAGRHWRTLSAYDQQRLVDAFSKLWISTYADRFNDYGGERFLIVGTGKAPHNTLMVKTKIIKNNGKRVAIDYLMRKKTDAWSIIDIFLKGRFSELAKQRAEYTSILKRHCIAGLIAAVDDKVQHMEQRGN